MTFDEWLKDVNPVTRQVYLMIYQTAREQGIKVAKEGRYNLLELYERKATYSSGYITFRIHFIGFADGYKSVKKPKVKPRKKFWGLL